MSGGGEDNQQQEDTGFLGVKRLKNPIKAIAHAATDTVKYQATRVCKNSFNQRTRRSETKTDHD